MTIGYQCKEPGCPAIVPRGQRFCDKHKARRPWARAQEKLSLYQSTRWQRLRKLKLGASPICEVCRNAPATAVHHIKQARLHPELQFTMSNLQSICARCHARESQLEATESKKISRGIGEK